MAKDDNGTPGAPINAPTHDVLGRPLTGDADARRRQQRDAVLERERRVRSDTDRLHRGLPPEYAG